MTTATAVKQRLSVRDYWALCKASYLAHWKQYTLPVVAVLLLQTFIRIDVNYTDSLHDHVFVTIKGWKSGLGRGDYVAYRFPTENPVSPFRKGDHMVKIVGGVGGDEVRVSEEGDFTIVGQVHSLARQAFGGDVFGRAKPYSKTGRPLERGPTGIIPAGHYYVFAPHKDSLDSRYALVGWIDEDDIIGRTFPIFENGPSPFGKLNVLRRFIDSETTRMKFVRPVALAVIAAMTLSGCAATHVAISKRELDVQTQTSSSIFLDPELMMKRTVFVQVKNTTDTPDFDVSQDVVTGIEAKGYTVVADVSTAQYIVQANVLYVGRSNRAASESALKEGYGGGLTGLGGAVTTAGTAYALGNSSSKGLVAIGLIGALAETVAGAAVKDVYYTAVTDVQVKERTAAAATASPASQGDAAAPAKAPWQSYQTRIVSTANQVNLDLPSALPAMRSGMVRSIAGIF